MLLAESQLRRLIRKSILLEYDWGGTDPFGYGSDPPSHEEWKPKNPEDLANAIKMLGYFTPAWPAMFVIDLARAISHTTQSEDSTHLRDFIAFALSAAGIGKFFRHVAIPLTKYITSFLTANGVKGAANVAVSATSKSNRINQSSSQKFMKWLDDSSAMKPLPGLQPGKLFHGNTSTYVNTRLSSDPKLFFHAPVGKASSSLYGGARHAPGSGETIFFANSPKLAVDYAVRYAKDLKSSPVLIIANGAKISSLRRNPFKYYPYWRSKTIPANLMKVIPLKFTGGKLPGPKQNSWKMLTPETKQLISAVPL
tara:strand:+ start:733 stop:1662 length:930 start_codon:yes stop_codon:yes gene_type:complete